MARVHLALLGIIAMAFGQAPPDEPKFEVASIRQNMSGPQGDANRRIEGDTLTWTNAPVYALITDSYGLRGEQLSKAPDWLYSERYDVIAKAADNVGRERLLLMLQSLLRQRFNFQFHRETKRSPGYVMTLVLDASKLQPSKEGMEPEPLRMMPEGLTGRKVSLAQLAVRMARSMDQAVVDQTGITGDFDFDLRWEMERGIPLGTPNSYERLRRELEKQVGLRFREQEMPMEIFVIDKIDRPTPN